MFKHSLARRLRGAFGNAVLWGACWSALAAGTMTVLKVVGILSSAPSWLDIIGMAIRIGLFGGIASGGFSLMIGLLYHRARLSQINWIKFGILGGVVTGVFATVFMQGLNILTGDGPIAWNLIDTDIIYSTIFGAISAAGSLRLAQHAERKLPGTALKQDDSPDMPALHAGGEDDLAEALRRSSREEVKSRN